METRGLVQEIYTQQSDFETALLREKLAHASIKEVITHLKETHELYRTHFVPRTEQLFSHLIESNPEQPSVFILFNLFQKFSVSLNVHMKLEEQHIFSKFESYFEDGNYSSFNALDTHQEEEPYLTEIISFLAEVSCENALVKRQLISLLTAFNQNLKEHAWIEETILTQKIQAKITAKIEQSVER